MSQLVLYSLGTLITLLAIASAAIASLRAMNPERSYTELVLRIKTWWWIIGVFVVAVAFSRTVSVVVMTLVSFMAFKEFLTLIPTRRADHKVLFWAYLSIPVQYLWVGVGWYGMFAIFIPLFVFLALPMRMVLIGETKGFLQAAGTLHWGLMTTVFAVSHLAFLLNLPATSRQGWPVEGDALFLFVVVLTQFNDVLQYIWGKSFGKHKIVPTVSPNKTVQGFVGGLATTTLLAGVLGPIYTPMDLRYSLLAGVMIGTFGFVGDVVMAAVKRDIGVKDWSDALPGHGGIIDRLNSLTFTAPLFFHYIHFLYF